jgi:hypothetical protein
MAAVKSIEMEVGAVKDLALIANDDSIWLVVPVRWWDFANIVWWVFCPADRRAKVSITLANGARVSFRAVRVASRHVRIRGSFRGE